MKLLAKFSKEKIAEIREKLESGWRAKGSCWEWTGKRNHCGYGTLANNLVHRLSYAIFKRDFYSVSFICHTCDNPACYNPDHLYEGNGITNGRDMAKRKRVVSRSIYKKAEGA